MTTETPRWAEDAVAQATADGRKPVFYIRFARHMNRLADGLRDASVWFDDLSRGLASAAQTRLAATNPDRAVSVRRYAAACGAIAKAYAGFARAADDAADAFMEAERAPYDLPTSRWIAQTPYSGPCGCEVCTADPLCAPVAKPVKPS